MDTIKILVVFGDKNSAIVTHKVTDIKTGKDYYKGFHWDVWNKIKKNLEHKYNFIIDFTKKDDSNYDSFIEKVYRGEYDLALGGFHNTVSREEKINYTHPLGIDANSILHRSKDKEILKELIMVIWKSSKLILYLLIFGILSGLLLIVFDPSRTIHYPMGKKNRKFFFLRSLLTGISSMFGEPGFLSENASLKLPGFFIVVIILIFSFLSIMFVQAAITRILIQQSTNNITINDIGYNLLLGHKGYAVVNKMKQFGANVELVEDLSTNDMIKKYLSNTNKYSGCILSYADAYLYKKKYKNFIISHDFGNEPFSWVVNNNKIKFLEDLNREILVLRTTGQLQRICHSYFGNEYLVPICSLV
tara:strand:- start:5125 stop:6204 length:1080 start_codon:yes stop_codon:yes gene_type:complete